MGDDMYGSNCAPKKTKGDTEVNPQREALLKMMKGGK